MQWVRNRAGVIVGALIETPDGPMVSSLAPADESHTVDAADDDETADDSANVVEGSANIDAGFGSGANG